MNYGYSLMPKIFFGDYFYLLPPLVSNEEIMLGFYGFSNGFKGESYDYCSENKWRFSSQSIKKFFKLFFIFFRKSKTQLFYRKNLKLN